MQRTVTSSHLSIDRTQLVLGFSDGTFQRAQLLFKNELLNSADLPAAVKLSEELSWQAHAGSVYQRFDATSVRRTELIEPQWSEAKRLGEGSISAIDYLAPESSSQLAQRSQSTVVAIVGDELVLGEIVRKKALIGGKVTETMTVERCQITSRSETGPVALALMNNGDNAVVVWPNGTLDRYTLAGGTPAWAESASGLLQGGKITFATVLLARQTLLCGDGAGRIVGWNIIRGGSETSGAPTASEEQAAALEKTSDTSKVEPSSTTDGYSLVPAHELRVGVKPIRAIHSSQQNHIAAVTDDDGITSLIFVTTDDVLVSTSSSLGRDARMSIFDPGDDTLLAVADDSIAIAPVNLQHPEASFATYFGKVWYEGYSKPEYIWQSSAGTEKAESKLSLMPLIFGTLKATCYAMLVSVPLALLAAVYTSEFLSPSARSRVKPMVELMASLPSVVLGFVAALVVAPLLQAHLMSVLLAILVIPLTFILAGNLWNLLPLDKLVRWQPLRLLCLIFSLPFGIWFAASLAPLVESRLFDGDLLQWLNDGEGSGVGGWMLLLTPALGATAGMIMLGPLAESTRQIAIARSPQRFAIFALVRLLFVIVGVLFLAWLIGNLFETLGWDTRGTLFDSYQDRNALLVGLALGFCVIPIIYTISDDALQAVPQSLRSASLGCGATPWQTTMRVVVPSAMSGLFSAIMIGFGRAVGETMVVLMAAGNTPVMEWNPFNGFRTLSATLATELPEAAKGSSHFRTLFLAALLLFVLTLIANTIAEFVRIRFRKRASQL